MSPACKEFMKEAYKMVSIFSKFALSLLLMVVTAPHAQAERKAKKIWGQNCFADPLSEQLVQNFNFTIEDQNIRLDYVELYDPDLKKPLFKNRSKLLFKPSSTSYAKYGYGIAPKFIAEDVLRHITYRSLDVTSTDHISSIQIKVFNEDDSLSLLDQLYNLNSQREQANELIERIESGEDLVEVTINRQVRLGRGSIAIESLKTAAQKTGQAATWLAKKMSHTIISTSAAHIDKNEPQTDFEVYKAARTGEKLKRKLGITHYHMYCPKEAFLNLRSKPEDRPLAVTKESLKNLFLRIKN